MTLHDVIQSDASLVFCNVSDFAETATYITRDGLRRCIDVVVERQNLQTLSEYSGSVTPVFIVHVANTCTRGISSDELNLGGDSIELAIRVGEEVSERTIVQLMEHDEGMLVLECR